MSKRNFRELIENQWARGNFVCVGLDSEFEKIMEGDSQSLSIPHLAQINFTSAIVRATSEQGRVCAYKPNIAFYKCHGPAGLGALKNIIEFIHLHAPTVPVILDCKRADIGNTNKGYVQLAFEYLQADAVTVNPYFGQEALQPFLDYEDKGIFVLCRTSNPGAGEFQDLLVNDRPLYEHVAFRVEHFWNQRGNCGLVVGATYPHELKKVREIAPKLPILSPGVGKQGGSAEQSVQAGKDSRGRGFIINSSSGIIFAKPEPGETFPQPSCRELLKLHNQITVSLQKGE